MEREKTLEFSEEVAGKDFCGRFGVRKSDNPVTEGLAEGGEHGITGIHAEGVVEALNESIERFTQSFEVTDHAVGVQFVCGDDDLDAAGMAMRKTAFIGVPREHVAVFNLEDSGNPVRHAGESKAAQGLAQEGRSENVDFRLGTRS